jgi:hypothetical protein
MAASLAFGILFATVITLFLIPALYMILDDFGKLKGWWREAWSYVIPKKSEKTAVHPESGSDSRPSEI